MTIIQLIAVGVVAFYVTYLIWQVAYRKGVNDQWKQISNEYICLHKSWLFDREKYKEKDKKTLDSNVKKRYNKKTYVRHNPPRRRS